MTHLAIILMGQGFTPNLDGLVAAVIAIGAMIAFVACVKILFK